MTERSPVKVFFLGFITLGIYHIFWLANTKGEMVARGADIPTTWMLIIPIMNWIWIWKYCQGVAQVTSGAMGAGVAFIIYLFAGGFAPSIFQSLFNKVPLLTPAAATESQ